LQVHDADKPYSGITLSIGVAIYPLHGRSIEDVIRAADAALYQTKHAARDQVVFAEKVN
jgi:diguanylate cyclase (GGDEF)-like protein